MSASTPILVALAVYLVAGVGVGLRLHREGHPPATAVSAFVAWPLLVGLAATDIGAPAGPYADRIRVTLDQLAESLRQPGAAAVASPEELAGLRRSLLAIDGRIGMVDRILAEPAVRGSTDPFVGRLADARTRAAAEVEAVLQGAVQLRVQAGLLALLGDTAPVRDRMRELGARVKAIEEIALA